MLWNKIKENRKAVIVIAEIIVLIAYSIYVLLDYNGTELVYQQEDMQIQNIDSNFDAGNYLDLSFENAKAIVTPALFLLKRYLTTRQPLWQELYCTYAVTNIYIAGIIRG